MGLHEPHGDRSDDRWTRGADFVVGTNIYLPTDFTGEDQTGWMERRFAILRASGQLRYALYLELPREHARALGSRLALLHPVPYVEVRGAALYRQFLDRAAWLRCMRLGPSGPLRRPGR